MIHAPFTVVQAVFNVIKIVIYRYVSHNIISSINSRETWFVLNEAMTGTYSNPRLIHSERFFGLCWIYNTGDCSKLENTMTPRDFFLVDAKDLVIVWSKDFSINNAFCRVFRSYTFMNKEGWKVMFYKINVSEIIVTVSLQQLNRFYCYQIFYLYDYDWHSWLQWFTLIINFPIFGVSKNHSALSKHDKYFNLQQFDIEEISQKWSYKFVSWLTTFSWGSYLLFWINK